MSTLIIFWYKFTYSYHIHCSGSMSGYSVKPLYFGRTRNVSINALVASWLCFGGSWNISYFLKWTCLPIIPKFDLLKAINISVSGSKKEKFPPVLHQCMTSCQLKWRIQGHFEQFSKCYFFTSKHFISIQTIRKFLDLKTCILKKSVLPKLNKFKKHKIMQHQISPIFVVLGPFSNLSHKKDSKYIFCRHLYISMFP